MWRLPEIDVVRTKMAWLSEFLFRDWQYLAVATFLIIYLAKQYFNHGLNSVPGPFLAKFTNVWRLLEVRKGDFHNKAINLHKRYGDFVRLGPNAVSIADPHAIKGIYGYGSKALPKGAFYNPFQLDDNGKGLPRSLLSVQDEKIHAVMRRPIASAYTMSTLVEYEPLVDTVIEDFLRELESRYAAGDTTECDIAAWLQYCKLTHRLSVGLETDMVPRCF